jgi:hypothetical protein
VIVPAAAALLHACWFAMVSQILVIKQVFVAAAAP